MAKIIPLRPEIAAASEPVTMDGATARRLRTLSRYAAGGMVGTFRRLAFVSILWLRPVIRFPLMMLAVSSWIALPLLVFGLPAGADGKPVLILAAVLAGLFSSAFAYLYDAALQRISR